MENKPQQAKFKPREYDPLPFFLKVTKELNFNRAANAPLWPELYREVWIENESRWGDSAKRRLFDLPGYDRLWDMFGKAAEFTVRRLASASWGRLSPNDLTHLYEAWTSVQIGIRFLAPAEITDPKERTLLFFDTLIRKAILDHIEGSALTPKYALVAYTGWIAGPAVEAEMHRRSLLHIGAHAAILKWCFALMRDNKAGFEFDDSWNESQRKLVESVSRNLYQTLRQYPDWKRQDAEEDIPDRIFEVLESEREYAGMDPLQALRTALEGTWDIFPRRIADRARDSLRSGHTTREEGRDLEEIMKIADEKSNSAESIGFGSAEARIDIDKFLAIHPEHRDAFSAVEESRTSVKDYGTLAAERGITDRALRLRIQKMMEDLHAFMLSK